MAGAVRGCGGVKVLRAAGFSSAALQAVCCGWVIVLSVLAALWLQCCGGADLCGAVIQSAGAVRPALCVAVALSADNAIILSGAVVRCRWPAPARRCDSFFLRGLSVACRCFTPPVSGRGSFWGGGGRAARGRCGLLLRTDAKTMGLHTAAGNEMRPLLPLHERKYCSFPASHRLPFW